MVKQELKSYFIENIWVPYKDYLKSRKSNLLAYNKHLNNAINLSIRLYHLREHIPNEYRKSKTEYIEICNDYKLLGNVVDAYKHSRIDRNNPLISNSEDIYEQVVITEYEDKRGLYHHIEISIFLDQVDGATRNLHDVIINVLNMWISEFQTLNILKKVPFQKATSNRIPRRNNKSGVLNIEAMQGLLFGPKRFLLRKYNYEMKIVEPVDLSGANIQMNLYKQIYDVDITFEKDGELQKITIEVDDSQKKFFDSLKSDKEKSQYLFEIAKEQKRI